MIAVADLEEEAKMVVSVKYHEAWEVNHNWSKMVQELVLILLFW